MIEYIFIITQVYCLKFFISFRMISNESLLILFQKWKVIYLFYAKTADHSLYWYPLPSSRI